MEICLNQSVHSQSNLNEIFLFNLHSNDFRVQMQLYCLKRMFKIQTLRFTIGKQNLNEHYTRHLKNNKLN